MKVQTYKTVTEALSDLQKRGFTANFEFLNNTFQALDSGRAFQAGDLTIVEHHRFEGVSDPDDMSVVYAIEGADGTRGILVDAFGVYANPDLGAFLKNVRMREER